MLVTACGLGLVFVPLSLIALHNVAAQDSGLAASLLNTGQQVGGAIGLAVLGTIAWSTVADTTRTTDAAIAAGRQPAQPAAELAAHALATGLSRGFLAAAGSRCSPWSSRSSPSGSASGTDRESARAARGPRSARRRRPPVSVLLVPKENSMELGFGSRDDFVRDMAAYAAVGVRTAIVTPTGRSPAEWIDGMAPAVARLADLG